MREINLECAEAEKHLLQYLTGQLDGKREGELFEAHVSSCDVCKSLVKDKRKALQALVAAMSPGVIGDPQPAETRKRIGIVIPAKQIKPLVVSGVLAIGLLIVSYALRPGSDLIGEKIGDSLPEKPAGANPVVSEQLKEDSTETTDAIEAAPPEGGANTEKPIANQPESAAPKSAAVPEVDANSTDEAKNATTQPAISSKPAKQPTVGDKPRQKATKRQPVPKKRKTSTPTTKPNKVEIFDESGKKVGETTQTKGS